MSAGGFRRVQYTAEELLEWRSREPRRPFPSTDRLECLACGKRIWGSGLGVGSHRRACEKAQKAKTCLPDPGGRHTTEGEGR